MKDINKATLITSCASLIISIIALCVICTRRSPLDFDWYGALIGVLSLLVTVLIGWNIYQGIDFDRRIENKVERALSGIGSEVEYMNDRTMYSILLSIASIMKEQTNSLLAFDMYLKAALFASKAKEAELTIDCLKNAIDIFDVMTTDSRMSFDMKIFKSKFRKLDDYIDMLKLIDNELSNTLIKKIILTKEN